MRKDAAAQETANVHTNRHKTEPDDNDDDVVTMMETNPRTVSWNHKTR